MFQRTSCCAFAPLSSCSSREITSSRAAAQEGPGFDLDQVSDLTFSENLGLSGGQVFEPQVNTPALGAFLFIAVVFGLLQIRINQVNDAAVRRKEALEVLRDVKAKELSNEGEQLTSETISQATLAYKESIEEEERLRTILPGVRVVAPNGPASQSDEEVAAAKQFLGIDLRAGKDEDEAKESTSMSGGAAVILAIVGLSQIVLLYVLSFDPMAPPTGSLYP